MEALKKATGKTPKELTNLLEAPVLYRTAWHWFMRLSRQRVNGMELNPIGHTAIASFFGMLGIKPEPYEVEIIELWDSMFRQASQDNK